MSLYLRPEDILQSPAPAEIGGKAAGLLALHRLRAPVPPWVVIPADRAGEAPWRDAAGAHELAALYAQWQEQGFSGAAARSSALVEDARDASHAGLFETAFADSAEALPEALDKVLASAANAPRAYRHHGRPSPMAIVLQAGVQPELAGVLFSAHPAEADPDLAYCEAVRGHGKALVGGEAAPARAWLQMPGGAVAASTPGEAGPDELDAALTAELTQWLLAIEAALDAPVDVEWAQDRRQLWFLQARPITAMRLHPRLNPPLCATSWFFDQRFNEPISPLTRSTLIELVARIGVGEALAIRGRPLPDPLIYDYAGQAYIAHEAFCSAFGGAPRWLLTPDLRQLFPDHCQCAQRDEGGALGYIAMTLKALLANAGDALFNLPRWRSFREAVRTETSLMPPASAEDLTLWQRQWERLDRLNERLLQLHRWSLLWADYGYRIFSGLKAAAPKALAEAWDAKLRREMRLPTAKANAALAAHLADPKDAQKRSLLAAQFGHRSASLDYAVPTWAELLETDALAQEYPYIREQAGQEAGQADPRGLVSWLMWPLRRALEMREEQRFTWERILARQRQWLRAATRRLHAQGKLGAEEEIWFLAWPELIRMLHGEEPPPAAGIARRQHAHRVYSACRRPPFIGPQQIEAASGGLQGTGAAGGVARGRVRKATGRIPELRHEAEPVILVMTALDPAGTAVLQHAAGVILERGGLLSHAAILARELDVPLVVGIPGVLEQLDEGMMVELDGRSGGVKVLESE